MLFRRETSHSNVGVDMYNRRRKNGNGRTANPDGELVVVQGDLSQEAAALLKTDFNLNLSADAMKKFGQYEDPQSPDEEHAPLSEEAFDIPEFVPASEEQVEEGAKRKQASRAGGSAGKFEDTRILEERRGAGRGWG